MEPHFFHLDQVFSCLSNVGFFFQKYSKCLFAQETLEYLGHIILAEGVAPEHSKIEAMLQWPVPKKIKQLRRLLGLTGYYRRFIKSYASIAHALTKLLKKDSFCWYNEAQLVFKNVKTAMTHIAVLSLLYFKELLYYKQVLQALEWMQFFNKTAIPLLSLANIFF